jgi:hypothetical protein
VFCIDASVRLNPVARPVRTGHVAVRLEGMRRLMRTGIEYRARFASLMRCLGKCQRSALAPQSIPNPRHKLTTSTLPAFPLGRTRRPARPLADGQISLVRQRKAPGSSCAPGAWRRGWVILRPAETMPILAACTCTAQCRDSTCRGPCPLGLYSSVRQKQGQSNR